MCRLLAYLGPSIQLDTLLLKPEHSLVVQSYQPQEMTSGLLNADGFGIGWYHPQRQALPFTYRSTLPIWNDVNLPQLSRYIESSCILANVRSATPGLPVDLANCQPFSHDRMMGIHNGYIEEFRQSLYRPIRDRLKDEFYQSIHGTTDSEHIFALLMSQWHDLPQPDLPTALHQTLEILSDLAQIHQVSLSANLIISDGKNLVASRFATQKATPSLYWLRDDLTFPDAVLIASEPLFAGNWVAFPERSILTVGEDLAIESFQF